VEGGPASFSRTNTDMGAGQFLKVSGRSAEKMSKNIPGPNRSCTECAYTCGGSDAPANCGRNMLDSLNRDRLIGQPTGSGPSRITQSRRPISSGFHSGTSIDCSCSCVMEVHGIGSTGRVTCPQGDVGRDCGSILVAYTGQRAAMIRHPTVQQKIGGRCNAWGRLSAWFLPD
jgi:hypothetical protein